MRVTRAIGRSRDSAAIKPTGHPGGPSAAQRRATRELVAARDFFQGTLDSLAAHIAVLDGRGEIIMTNRAWDAFALANGGGAAAARGSNYLAACDGADEDGQCSPAAEGLRAIIAGTRSELTLEYPCHGPGATRWFLMRAARYQGPGPARVVVAHDDITSRRVAETRAATQAALLDEVGVAVSTSERALLAARNYMRAVADTMGEGLFTLDPDGVLIYMNAAAEELLGWSMQELRGRVMHEVTHSRRVDGRPLPVEDCPILRARRDGVSVRIEDDHFIDRKGRFLPVAYTATPFVTDDGIEGCVVIVQDVTERKAKERHLERHVETLRWIGRMQEAFEQDRFVLYAQPIIDVCSGEVAQRELLLRIREPGGEIIAPTAFLPVAEQYGLIGDIDRWVIARASEIAAVSGAVELNLSARSMGDRTILDYIEQCMQRTGVDPTNLVFEITETALVADEAAAVAFADRLHSLGCKLALDDFGTGYGGFTYLKRFPVDFLKIDVEFVRDLPTNPASRYVVEAVATLARAFDLKMVAEGVEDAETLDLLREIGVEYAQGYHIARPALQDERLSST
jgi:PAS domain S-box-containing protein